MVQSSRNSSPRSLIGFSAPSGRTLTYAAPARVISPISASSWRTSWAFVTSPSVASASICSLISARV